MKNSELDVPSEFRSCRWCGFDSNPISVDSCEVCNRPLGKTSPTDNRSSKVSSWLPLALLGLAAIPMLVGGVGYWMWRQPQPIAKSAAKISGAPDIKLYPTMKDVPNVPKGLFSYHGAINFAAIVSRGMHNTMQQAHSEFRLRYTEPTQDKPGSSSAIRMLIDGEVNIAQSARPLEDAEFKRAKERNLTLEQIPVAIDAVGFYTHPSVSIPGLSLNQIQDIYLGKVKNWKDLGGPNLPIVPLTLEPKATGSPKQALGDVADKLGPTVRIIRDHTDGIRQTGSTPGAIAFGGAVNAIGQKSVRLLSIAKANSTKYVSLVTDTGAVNKQAFRDGSYPLTRRAFVIIRRNGSLDEQVGVAYANLFLSGEGQRIIENAGFVPLY
jgi:phosphate transport system substrate-binding protein